MGGESVLKIFPASSFDDLKTRLTEDPVRGWFLEFPIEKHELEDKDLGEFQTVAEAEKYILERTTRYGNLMAARAVHKGQQVWVVAGWMPN